tara:strand:+ start:4837 stop:5298 length:462 start_codon:yes stop_codon:yes gene_type:complete
MYRIHQVKLSEAVYDFVNGPEGGHTKTAEKFPEYNTHMEVMHRGSKGYTPEMFAHYTQVCVVKDFDGSTLEHVFKILNGYYFDEDTDTDEWFDAFVYGFKLRTITRKNGEVVTYRDMHSLSVGDIVEDTSTGEFHMVDGMGFKQIETKSLEVA